MSCTGFFETLLRRADEESFNKQVLREIHKKKQQLARKLESLRVRGDLHKVTQAKDQLDYLEKTEKIIKKLVEKKLVET